MAKIKPVTLKEIRDAINCPDMIYQYREIAIRISNGYWSESASEKDLLRLIRQLQGVIVAVSTIACATTQKYANTVDARELKRELRIELQEK